MKFFRPSRRNVDDVLDEIGRKRGGEEGEGGDSKIKGFPFGERFRGLARDTLTLVVGAELLLKLFFGWL